MCTLPGVDIIRRTDWDHKNCLTEENILVHLKRKSYVPINRNPLPGEETCCICRGEYDTGAVNCGHEFHTDCIKKWLVILLNHTGVVCLHDFFCRLYMKEKYNSEDWFQQMLQPEFIPIKDALKLSITNPLEMLLGVKFGSSSLPVRLTYASSEQPMKTDNGKRIPNLARRGKQTRLASSVAAATCLSV